MMLLLFLASCPSFLCSQSNSTANLDTLTKHSFNESIGSENCVASFDKEQGILIYHQVDQVAQYKGKPTEFLSYLYTTIDYPEGSDQYRLALELYLDNEGNIMDARVVDKDEDDYTKLEINTISTLKQMPKWNPGRCENIPVHTLYPLSLHFTPSK